MNGPTPFAQFLREYQAPGQLGDHSPHGPGGGAAPPGAAPGRRWTVLAAVAVAVGLVVCFGHAIAHGAPQAAPVAEREAVLLVTTPDGALGSGVIVDPSGLALSVRHVTQDAESVTVQLRDGRTLSARVAWPGEMSDDVSALRLPPGTYPAAPLAGAPPPEGAVVHSFGYPSGRFESLSGVVTDPDATQGDDDVPVVMTNLPARGGHSGGPLFDLDGRIVGICSTSITARVPVRVDAIGSSAWIAPERCAAALAAARPALYVFKTPTCAPCNQFSRDYASDAGGLKTYLDGRFRVVPVTYLDGQGWDQPAAHQAFRAATGGPVSGVPTFWVEGHPRAVSTGYGGPEALRRWAASVSGPALEPKPTDPPPIEEFGRPGDAPAPGPAPESTPPADQVDWSAVQLIVLRSNPELSDAAKTAVRLAQDTLSGPIRRRLSDATGARADVQVVHAQVTPARYAAVAAAVGRDPGHLLVVAVVRRQELGLVKGQVAGLVEAHLADLVPGKVPVELIAERTDPAAVAAVEAALLTPEAPAETGSVSPWWYTVAASVLSAIAAILLARFGRKGKGDSEPAAPPTAPPPQVTPWSPQ